MKILFAVIGILAIVLSAFVGGAQAASCGGIWIDTSTVRVEKGETAYAVVFVQNDTEENFLVDFASVFDSSNNLKADEAGYEKTVPAFGSGYINAKIEAYDFAEAGRDEAFVEVRGHLQNGQSCNAGGIKAIPVIIGEKAAELQESEEEDYAVQACTYFSLIAPESAEFEKSGTVPITIDNRTMDRATVRLYGPGLTVQPNVISIPRNTLYSERVSVSSVLLETALVFEIDALGCDSKRTTKIITTGSRAAPASGGEGQQGTGIAIPSGLFLLGTAGAILGIVVLVGIALYIILKR